MWKPYVAAVLLGAVALLASVLVRAGPDAPPAIPEFATATADGAFRVYSSFKQVTATQFAVQDASLNATITNLGDDKWQLVVEARQPLQTLYFPWQTNRTPLDDDKSDDYYYFPFILGISERASSHDADWTWWGLRYPGEAFAPLVVMADASSAIIVAATNWPPRTVTPLYAAQRLVLRYDDGIRAGDSATFQALVARVRGNEAVGNAPWQLALDRYRAWLDTHVKRPEYPSWMWSGHGFLNIQLENGPFSIAAIDKMWQPVKSIYPWIVFWGQMTSTGGGCCVLNQTMSSAYRSTLVSYIRDTVVGAGYHASYYSAPEYSKSSMRLDVPQGVSWLSSWLAANRAYGADSYYIDTLGRQYYGDPAQVLELFKAGTIPDASLIEGVVDIYPAAGLVSGALVGDANLCGAPLKTPAKAARTTFPRFGRYLLGDRLMYSGQSNTDWRFWGAGAWSSTTDDGINAKCGYEAWCSANGPCAYGVEHLNFLLGAKLDVMTPADNPVLDAINEERQRVNWWARQPVYRDTRGLDLAGIPPSSAVQIRRFIDRNGVTLIAISNPNTLAGLTFTVDGVSNEVPARSIAVLDFGNPDQR